MEAWAAPPGEGQPPVLLVLQGSVSEGYKRRPNGQGSVPLTTAPTPPRSDTEPQGPQTEEKRRRESRETLSQPWTSTRPGTTGKDGRPSLAEGCPSAPAGRQGHQGLANRFLWFEVPRVALGLQPPGWLAPLERPRFLPPPYGFVFSPPPLPGRPSPREWERRLRRRSRGGEGSGSLGH